MEIPDLYTLKQLACIQIALKLWNRTDVLRMATLREFGTASLGKAFQKVKELVDTLQLPADTRETMTDTIALIGYQLYQLLNMPYKKYLANKDVWSLYQWNSLGRLDEIATFRRTLDNKCDDKLKAFILACIYCQRDIITSLYSELSRKSKHLVATKHATVCPVICYWLNEVDEEGEHDVRRSLRTNYGYLYKSTEPIHMNLYCICVTRCYNQGIEYFFELLTDGDKLQLVNDPLELNVFQFTYDFILVNQISTFVPCLLYYFVFIFNEDILIVTLRRLEPNMYCEILYYLQHCLVEKEPHNILYSKIFFQLLILAPQRLTYVLLNEDSKMDLYILTFIANGETEIIPKILKNEPIRAVVYKHICRRFEGLDSISPLIRARFNPDDPFMLTFFNLLGSNEAERNHLISNWDRLNGIYL